MARVYGKPSASMGLSLAMATLVFVLTLPAASTIWYAIFIPVSFGMAKVGISDTLPIDLMSIALSVVAFASSIVVAFYLARTVYNGLRWPPIPRANMCCKQCGYDLTGNESGRCPECGETIQA